MTRPLALHAHQVDVRPLLSDWAWLLPEGHVPLFVGAFGDCIFGAPDGSLWALSLLEGDYRQVAADSPEFNRLNKDPANLNDWFTAEWVSIAAEHGLVPSEDECLGWKLHPILGGEFAVANIGLFSVRIYHSLIGQLFRQLRTPSA